MFLKVFALLMKKSKHPKKIKKKHTFQNNKDQVTAISSFKDQYLNADIGVRGSEVLISIGGFFNEVDAILWAKMQTEIWLKTADERKNISENKTLH
jgi:hypothetical protein